MYNMRKYFYIFLVFTFIISYAHSEEEYLNAWYISGGEDAISDVARYIYSKDKYIYKSKNFNVDYKFENSDGRTVFVGRIEYVSEDTQKEYKLKTAEFTNLGSDRYQWSLTKPNDKVKTKIKKYKVDSYFINIIPFVFASDLRNNKVKDKFNTNVIAEVIQNQYELAFLVNNMNKDEIVNLAKKEKYTLPKQLIDALSQNSGNYKVLKIKVKPPADLIINFAYYYIFDIQNNYEPIIYFGGKPKEADYIVLNYKE